MRSFSLELDHIEKLRRAINLPETPPEIIAVVSDTQLSALRNFRLDCLHRKDAEEIPLAQVLSILKESILNGTQLPEAFFKLVPNIMRGDSEERWQNRIGILVKKLQKTEEIKQWVIRSLAEIKDVPIRNVETCLTFEKIFGFGGPIPVEIIEEKNFLVEVDRAIEDPFGRPEKERNKRVIRGRLGYDPNSQMKDGYFECPTCESSFCVDIMGGGALHNSGCAETEKGYDSCVYFFGPKHVEELKKMTKLLNEHFKDDSGDRYPWHGITINQLKKFFPELL